MALDISTVDRQKLGDAIFRLGQISADPAITNESLLRRTAEVVAGALDLSVAALGVFERGIQNSATSCFVHSPWTLSGASAFEDQAFWALEDRNLAMALSGLRFGRLYQKSELLALRGANAVAQAAASTNPARCGEGQALALFRRQDGCELLIGIHSPVGQNQISPETLEFARILAPFVAQCWASVWRSEPLWMTELKPQARTVLERLLQGYDDDQIALRSGLSYHSVRAHLKRMFRAAGVRSRLHLMQSCRRGMNTNDCACELAQPEDSAASARGAGSKANRAVRTSVAQDATPSAGIAVA